MTLSYQSTGLVLQKGGGGAKAQIKDLQRDLRKLGYLKGGIDGVFGGGTELAVLALQYDLLNNKGNGTDGKAPVSVRDYNRSRVTGVSGLADQKLAACISEMLADDNFCKLPSSSHPADENAKVAVELAAMPPQEVPSPFLCAILKQESGMKHFCEPSSGNDDNFVVVGLDRNAKSQPAITSRGYGVGQYTLFHHPPSKEEVAEFIHDVKGNVQRAVRELKVKFDSFVNGNTPGTRADDRQVEFGRGALRPCKYSHDDPRYMADCRRCMVEAGRSDIKAGVTRFYEGARRVYEPTQYHREMEYNGVPIRGNIPCDWPYAVRRYNGGGVDSYHYQTQVLLNVLRG